MSKDSTHDEEDDGYASKIDNEHQKYDDDIIEDDVEDDFIVEDPLDSNSSYKYVSNIVSDL